MKNHPPVMQDGRFYDDSGILATMNLLMISGDRSILQGKKGPFWYLLEEMVRYWNRIDVITPYAGRNHSHIDEQGLFGKVHFHPSSHRLWYQPRWIVKKGKELIRSHAHTVISVHEYPPFYNGLGTEWLSRRTGVPYALEIHHIVGYPKAASPAEWIGKHLSHLFLVNDAYGASKVRCVSRGAAGVLERWGARKDTLYIIPSFYLDQESLQPDPTIQKEFDIVCCGRLVANKGHKEVLHALQKLPEAMLLIVGDGPLRWRLENYAERLKVSDRVHFAGWLPESSDVYRAIQSAKVFVMNSKSEGGPRVALEAMALGMPIISTRVGVMPDVIRDGENGRLMSGTTKDLVEKLETLLSYPSMRDQMGREARKILTKFERTDLIRRYAEFLKSCANSS
jgi:glycosyltransferase involved in cell wall biosynthesis